MPVHPRPIASSWFKASLLIAFGLGPIGTARAIDFRWIGQDGHDSIGGHPGPAPNDFQDIHLVVRGIPPRRRIVHVVIRGHGSGEWATDKQRGNDLIDIVRKPGATTADLYIEPFGPETGREFEVHLRYDTGEEVVAYTRGGKADPNLRVAGRGLEIAWLGPDGSDRVGMTAGVGPDGVEDVRIAVAKLTAGAAIRSVAVAGPEGLAWSSGLNSNAHRNAEFLRDPADPTRGVLAIGVDRDLAGQALKAFVDYEDGRTDSRDFRAGGGRPPRPLPTPALPDLGPGTLSARWLGQDGAPAGPGAVHVAVDGLEPGRTIVAAALTDSIVGNWTTHDESHPGFPLPGDPDRLAITRGGPDRADLAFPPCRDESDTTMILRVRDDRGRESILRFPGGACDLAKQTPPLPPGSATAHPGDDLQALVDRVGTVTLAPGTYPLPRPLILNRPTRIVGQPGAILRFQQSADQPAWTTAIKIHKGGTTLEGFAVRFAGPVRWDWDVSFGPALIGTTDNRDPNPPERRHGVVLARLDLEAPPSSSDKWSPCVNLTRLLAANSGRVEGCTLRGGGIVFAGGPWTMSDNLYRGAMPRTFAYDLFSGRYSHDAVVARNRVEIAPDSGKTWRFLVLTQRGTRDEIADNVVAGIGAREDDPIPHPNAPEVILTEAYRLHFEGKPAAISADGRVVAIPEPQGSPAIATGDALAILAGPQAGQWRTVAQPIGPRVFLLDGPIDPATEAISIATGFTRETVSGNTVDTRGSGQAANLVLAGNHFGVRVAGNHLIGGAESVRLVASATEDPVFWGWSHAPFLGATIEENVLEDAISGGIGIEHSPHVKSSQGRVYASATLSNNVLRRTDRAPKAGGPMLRVGYGPARDAGAMVVTESGTRFEGAAPEPAARATARINGRIVHDAPLSGEAAGRGDRPPPGPPAGSRPPGPRG
ncbi:hypothetical protein TA3x_004244 [Tundrisphaera sp. TA3]|uniref:hypothetical protein n=1 Tax=Tundrisphaera sp. TA3 TaxID=3435775 RepID=UPI003EBF0F12